MSSTSTRAVYRTGFERVYDSRAGRRILERLVHQPDPDRRLGAAALMTGAPAKDPA